MKSFRERHHTTVAAMLSRQILAKEKELARIDSRLARINSATFRLTFRRAPLVRKELS